MRNANNGPRSRNVLLISIAVQVFLIVFFWFCTPLRKSVMAFDPSESEQKSKAVEAANKLRVKEERQKREKLKLKEDDAKALMKHEDEKRKRELKDKLKQMQEIKKEIKEKKIDKIGEILARDTKRECTTDAEKIIRIANAIAKRLSGLSSKIKTDYTKELGRLSTDLASGTKEFIGNMLPQKADSLMHTSGIITVKLRDCMARLSKTNNSSNIKNASEVSGDVNEQIEDYQFLLSQMVKRLEKTINKNGIERESLKKPVETNSKKPSLKDMKLAEVVDHMKELEKEIRDEFSQLRAAELAQVQNVSYEQANESIQNALESEISEAEDLQNPENTENTGGNATEKINATANSNDNGNSENAVNSNGNGNNSNNGDANGDGDGNNNSEDNVGSSGNQNNNSNGKNAGNPNGNGNNNGGGDNTNNKGGNKNNGKKTNNDNNSNNRNNISSKNGNSDSNNNNGGNNSANSNNNGSNSQSGNANGSQSTNNGGGNKNANNQGGAAVRTIGDLNRYRNNADRMVQNASMSYSKAMNMGSQAGALGAAKSAMGMNANSINSSQQGKGAQGGGNSTGDSAGGSTGGFIGEGGTDKYAGRKDPTKQNPGNIKVPEAVIKAKALPGRRFEKESKRHGWLYIDTWYIIGPWENNNKLNYSITHPPEIEVDLEAEYSDGKIDKITKKPIPLKWTFVQSDTMKIRVPKEKSCSTYYCSTEVYFEEESEMLLAIASDDAARMWVNDKLVWEDKGLSAWRLSEGFRSVHFKKGFNKILVRVENFPQYCLFSVLLCPKK